MSNFLAVVEFYSFCRIVVLRWPNLLSAESKVISLWYFPLFSVLSCLDFFNWYMFYFFVSSPMRLVWWIVYVVGQSCFGWWVLRLFSGLGFFSRINFSRSVLLVEHVINFDMSRSTCSMFLKSQFCFLGLAVFSNVLLVSRGFLVHLKEDGISTAAVGISFGHIMFLKQLYYFVLIVPGSVLISPSMNDSIADGPEPQIKSYLIWFFCVPGVTGWYRVICQCLFEIHDTYSFCVEVKILGSRFGLL